MPYGGDFADGGPNDGNETKAGGSVRVGEPDPRNSN
jgi:hypothetical protein